MTLHRRQKLLLLLLKKNLLTKKKQLLYHKRRRFVSYVEKLHTMLKEGSVPICFNTDVNILKARGIKKARALKIARHLERLLKKPHYEGLRDLAKAAVPSKRFDMRNKEEQGQPENSQRHLTDNALFRPLTNQSKMSAADLINLRHDLLQVYQRFVEDTEAARNGLVKSTVDFVLKDFRDKGYLKELFYTGSAYEKLSVGSKHDFDIDVVLNAPRVNVVSSGGYADFVKLEYGQTMYRVGPRMDTSNPDLSRYVTNGFYSAVKIRKLLESSVDRVLSLGTEVYSYQGESFRVKRSIHGPAVTLHINHPQFGEITVDLVAAINVNGSTYKVKPVDKNHPDDEHLGVFWRKSYSEQEKDLLDGVDRGNEIRRKVLRIFKAIKKRNAQLNSLPSYVYKNVLFYTMDERLNWADSYLAERFVSYVQTLQRMLQRGSICIYYNRQVDILTARGITRQHALEVARYLERLLARPNLSGLRELARGACT